MKKLVVFTFISLFVLLLAACAKEDETIQTIPFETITQNNPHKNRDFAKAPKKETFHFVKEEKKLEKLSVQEEDIKKINFKNERAVYLTLGRSGSSGHRIQLKEVELKGDTLTFYYQKEISADPNQVIEDDYSLYKIDTIHTVVRHVEFKEITK